MGLNYLTAGESHGPALTAILQGMPAGLPLKAADIDFELQRRQKGFGSGARMKIEKDSVRILGGVMAEKSTGGPICLMVENADHQAWQGKPVPPMTRPRPGHADLIGAVKFGFRDLRPSLERASARETTMRVAVGAVCKQFLGHFGIQVGGYVLSIGDEDSTNLPENYLERFKHSEGNQLRCPDVKAAEQMESRIKQAMQNKDTLGGIIEIFAVGLPAGLGSFTQWNTRLESKLAQAVTAVQAVKGVEFGDGFSAARLPGTQAQDAIGLVGQNIIRSTNHAGGIEGGITNGQPLVLRAAIKPIATTLTPQKTVDLADGLETETKYERSDFCPVPRAVPILEAAASYVLADALVEKLGGDSLAEMKPRFEQLRKLSLDDLPMDNHPHTWWE